LRPLRHGDPFWFGGNKGLGKEEIFSVHIVSSPRCPLLDKHGLLETRILIWMICAHLRSKISCLRFSVDRNRRSKGIVKSPAGSDDPARAAAAG
jgi:hypothetical protein